MKHFLKKLGINNIPDIDIVTVFDVITDNGSPFMNYQINGTTLYNNNLELSIAIKHTVHLIDPIEICITMNNKKYDVNKETAIIIKSVEIDGINVIPKFNHMLIHNNEQNVDITTNYIGFNGTCTLDINMPFYMWLHDVRGEGWVMPEKNYKKLLHNSDNSV